MAGPNASILIGVFNQDKYNKLDKFIHTISDNNSPNEGDYWLFTPKNGEVVERKKKEKGCSFVIAVQPFNLLYGSSEIEQINAKLGFLPTQEISLAAMCNKVDDHIILGKLAYKVAEMLDGFIDMSGVICPPTGRGDNIEEIRDFVGKIKGRIVEIEYQTASEAIWYYHIVDKVFLLDWMQNPNFHMVK